MRRGFTLLCLVLFMAPLTGSLGNPVHTDSQWSSVIPEMTPVIHEDIDWWERTTMDSNRNGIFDSLETLEGPVGVGLSYGRDVTDSDVALLESMGYEITDVIESVDAILLGVIDSSDVWTLSELDGVVMVERYGKVVFWGDIQTPNIKSEPSEDYPHAAWNHSPMGGLGINIAMVDTGVDNEHPGLNSHPVLESKFVAGYDAVCYLHTGLLTCIANSNLGNRETDGSFDPDDGNQHGTACMGMASATGLDASGEQTGFEGSAPNASLIDVRIGTDAGAGPFENYALEQSIYESAVNGIEWIIDNKDTEWEGVDERFYGIDIISLSWGITSHEGGGSDGEDMHSRILNVATEAGVTVSVAAGNDGPSNDGLSGMGSSSLSITVGATDDMNTVNRDDDTIAGYSSRGPRRDNGDSNPINEMKPDVTAPGSNIIQAEACVTTGSCINSVNGDASENGYTGRGSGTSYATPAVSGVIALMMEVNDEIGPLTIREILRSTATRMGPASQPEHDPHWNVDYGWGLVDAHDAVWTARYLNDTGINTSTMNLDLQVHIENISSEGTVNTYTGQAWSRGAVMDKIEYSVDGGDTWTEVMYESVNGSMSTYESFQFQFTVDTDILPEGYNMVIVRGVDETGASSMISWDSVIGGGNVETYASAESLGRIIFIAIFALSILVFGAWVVVQQKTDDPLELSVIASDVESLPPPVDDEPLEATLVDDVPESTSS
ncbi:MAG: S8 family serine peptidase [Euryarchaeota archaeon]|jgi:subtilisin family serine protease|nr:S8 family serine peptidase [Euryarchaeota archaeon]MBT4983017.1 S8 family serine peptidase [Euryarchaeota archaeon]MBT5184522.1 S8 family serine peptidase [Euryarchaeota archaeon]